MKKIALSLITRHARGVRVPPAPHTIGAADPRPATGNSVSLAASNASSKGCQRNQVSASRAGATISTRPTGWRRNTACISTMTRYTVRDAELGTVRNTPNTWPASRTPAA